MTSEEFTASGPNALRMAKGALQSLDIGDEDVEAIQIRVEYGEAEVTETETESLEATADTEQPDEDVEEDSDEPSFELKPDTQKFKVLRALVKNYENKGLTSKDVEEILGEDLNVSYLLGKMAGDELLQRNEVEDRGHREPKWKYEPTEFGLGELQRVQREQA
jgi:hypothetical protein